MADETNTAETADSNVLTYGDSIKVDFTTLPAVSQLALMQRGFTHVLGNEVASRVHSWSQGESQANSEDRKTVADWKAANAEAVTAKTAEVQADFLKAITEGTLGSRTGGPRLTPLETVMNRIARGEIETILRANGIKVPKKDDTVEMPDGKFTMAQLIQRRLDKPETGDAIKKAAAKEIAAKSKQIDNVKADAKAALAAL